MTADPEALALLSRAGWAGAVPRPIAGDASARRYWRLSRPRGGTAILMQAPGTEAAHLDAYVRVAALLRAAGLAAPAILAADRAAGWLLVEDLGTETLGAGLDAGGADAAEGYRLAAELLPRIAAIPATDLPAPGPREMAAMIAPLRRALPGADRTLDALEEGLAEALERHAGGAPVLSLRDVHGDNLVWRPGLAGAARIGWLDFQDARLLPRGYDLASLFDDVRRVVPEAWRDRALAAFAEADGMAEAAARRRIDLLSLQRNLRILGLFRGLATAGRPAYARFLPRTRSLVARAAAAPGLAALARPVATILDAAAGWEDAA